MGRCLCLQNSGTCLGFSLDFDACDVVFLGSSDCDCVPCQSFEHLGHVCSSSTAR